MRTLSRFGWQLLLPISLFFVWAFWTLNNAHMFFPSPLQIWEAFSGAFIGPGLVEHVLPSLLNLAVGYVLGVVAGIGIGVSVGASSIVDSLLKPLLTFGRALPPPALLPFAILILGVGAEMKIGLIAFGVFFPVLLNTIDGIRSLDTTLNEMTKVYRFPPRMRLFKVWLPAASPQILAGCRTSLSIGLLLMVVSEMVASTQGIGFFTLQSQRNFAIPDMWAGMLLLAIIGVVLTLVFSVLQSRMLQWQTQSA